MSFYRKNRRPVPEEEKCADPAKARVRALDALAAREMTSTQLYERLCSRFTEQAAAAAVADMVELYLRMGNMNSEGKQEKLLLKMMEEAKDMIHNSVEAFVEGDEANAQKVVEHDDVVDDLFNDMKKEMMQAIREQNLDADRVVDYLMMAKYLEKVGDHAVNIAQWAIFRMTGDMEGVKLY